MTTRSVDPQAIIRILQRRIAELELNNAVLQAALESMPEPTSGDDDEPNPSKPSE